MDMDNDIKITIQLKDKASLLANAIVSLNTIAFGFVTIKDFQIWRSKVFNDRLQEQINIKPPTRAFFGKFLERVFIEDKNKWYELEQMIYDAFNNERNKKQANNNNEEVNIDDIPL